MLVFREEGKRFSRHLNLSSLTPAAQFRDEYINNI